MVVLFACEVMSMSTLVEETGEKTFKSEYITPGAGIDLEFETDGKFRLSHQIFPGFFNSY